MSKVRLGCLCDTCLGKMLDKEKNKGQYQPYLANINVRWGDFDLENLSQMRFEENETERYGIQKGDLIICEGGEPGRCAVWEDEIPNMKIQKALHRVRPKEMIDVYYLYFWFLLAGKNKLLERYFTKTTIKHLTGIQLNDLEIDVKEINQQKKISAVLKNLDKKIQLNNKINKTLQQQAHDIFMHVFFRKAPNGKIADILLENEKSTIQVGEAKATTGNYPFLTSGEAILEWKDLLVKGRNCFLNTGGNADVKFYVGDSAYSTDTWCITAKNGLSDYLYLFLNSIKTELGQKFFQGTGLKHLQKELLKDRPIYIPDEKEISAFNKTICPMFDMISEKTRENQHLASIRDWLLPMLMNGQVTVK